MLAAGFWPAAANAFNAAAVFGIARLSAQVAVGAAFFPSERGPCAQPAVVQLSPLLAIAIGFAAGLALAFPSLVREDEGTSGFTLHGRVKSTRGPRYQAWSAGDGRRVLAVSPIRRLRLLQN